jgi:Protein of unknown function (DUF2721)
MLTLTTPAILFPTVSLFYIAYTNRFVTLSNLVRSLKQQFIESHDEGVLKQITNLRRRINIIRNMQLLAIASLFAAMLSMTLIYNLLQWEGEMAFGLSLGLLMLSMYFAMRELLMSVDALNIELNSIEELRIAMHEKKGLIDIGADIRRLPEKLGLLVQEEEEEG